MRDIKFRVWTGLEMEYRVVVGNLGAFYASGIDPTDSCCIGTTTLYHKETPLMQYTGLKDKGGKEIYERDIIKTTRNDEDGEVIETWQVYWDSTMGGWWLLGVKESDTDTLYACKDTYQAEIIGNIYENEEFSI